MADISINFAGIKSPNPFWLASGPLTNTAYQVMKAFDLGWGGAVWKTVGIPIVNVYSRYGGLTYHGNRLVGLNNNELITDRSYEENYKEIYQVKKKYPKNALLVSLMFETKQEWKEHVKRAIDSGADGLELNFGCPHGMCERGMGSAVGQEPKVLKEVTSWVLEYSTVPVLVKLTPNISDIREPGMAAQEIGAHGVSLINTIKSIIGIDVDSFSPVPSVGGKGTNGGYCGPAVKPIALHMVGALSRMPGWKTLISGIGGIQTWRDAVEFILLGAASLQVCTAAMHYGFRIVEELNQGLSDYMDSKGFKTIEEFRGKAVKNYVEWGDLNLNYRVKAEINPKKCIECQLCVAACDAGGHQCIHTSQNGTRVPYVDQEACIGCNLCSLVCPVEDCITMKEIDLGKPYLTWREYQKTAVS
jgi:dihydropyrimidine dehydrogenase (NAD+) subunit PreA